MPKRPAIDIEFQDLSFTAGRRMIIKNISGCFKSGELTAILGPSGAGKSTLMNILVGYVTAGVTGSILTNGYPRQMKIFNKLSSYIMQDDVLQPNLKVRECLLIAAHLKLGNELSNEDKDAAVDEILATLGLTKCANTFLEQLSGGQRKRVAVAQELVNNPPVIFLDEPTTGLDVVSINKCVQLLKRLSRQGRTIVCTIHQPSAMLFHQFDHVYMVARGRCVYQGSSNQVVPFLSDCGLQCPSTYNPADYAIEVLTNETINVFSTEIQNGRINRRDPCCEQTDSINRICSNDKAHFTMFESSEHSKHIQFPTSFWVQFCIILKRMMLQKARNKFGLYLQIIHHVFSGIIVGAIFHGIGDNASRPFDNFKLIICVNVFFMYTHCMTPILTFPIEKKVMRREFFNRWYSLKAYYLALTLSTIPLIVTLGLVFNTISYIMSDLPLEWERFLWFNVMTILTGLIAEGQGILIGFTFNPTNGVVAGPSTMSVILMLSLHGMGFGMHIVQLMRYVMNLSYLRFSLVGLVTALFLNGRKEMICKEANFLDYCHYKDPRLLVEDMGMENQETATQLIGLIAYLLLFRIAAYLSLRLSLTTEVSNRVLSFFRKIIKGKEL